MLLYLYWRFPHDDVGGYGEMMDRALNDEAVMAAHLEDLARFCDHADAHHVPLVVVVFPMLLKTDLDRPALDRVEAMFLSRGAKVIDATALVEPLSPAERTANPCDSHPSPEVHRRVAGALGEVLAGL